MVFLTRQIAEKVAHTMSILTNMTYGWETDVLELMEAYHVSPVSTENLETPEDYLRRCNVYMIREISIFTTSFIRDMKFNLFSIRDQYHFLYVSNYDLNMRLS